MSKGNNGEREVIKLITPWWHQVDEGAEFARTPRSGGWRASMLIRKDMKLAGDIMTSSKIWPFTTEVKRREGWSEEWLRKGRKSPVWKWWRQTLQDAREEEGIPMLWFRQNRRPWFVMMPALDAYDFALHRKLAPEMLWDRSKLGNDPPLDYGAHDHGARAFPVVYLGSKLLGLPASTFVT